MTDFSSMLVADRGQSCRTVHLVDKKIFEAWLKKRPPEDRALLAAQRFDGKTGFDYALLPRGGDFEVVSTVANASELSPWCLAKLAETLPEGSYRLEGLEPGQAALGWLLGQHSFEPYRSARNEPDRGPRVLVTGDPATIDTHARTAEATALVRELVNTPAGDLGPAELEQAVRETASEFGAKVRVTTGKELAEGYPLIAAVGGAAIEASAVEADTLADD